MQDMNSPNNLEALLKALEDAKEKKILSDKLGDLSNKAMRTGSAAGDGFVLKGKPTTVSSPKPNFTIPSGGNNLPVKAGNVLPDVAGEVVSKTVSNIDEAASPLAKYVTGPLSTVGKSALGRAGGLALKGLGLGASVMLDSEALAEGADEITEDQGLSRADLRQSERKTIEAQQEREKAPTEFEKNQMQAKARAGEVSKEEAVKFLREGSIPTSPFKGEDYITPDIGADSGSEEEPITEEESSEDKAPSTADRLYSAQQTDADNDFINTLLRSGVQIGSAIGGVKGDYSGVDALEKNKGTNTRNLKGILAAEDRDKKSEQEAFLDDPNHPLAMQLRESMKKPPGS